MLYMPANRHSNECVLSKIRNEWKAMFALSNTIVKGSPYRAACSPNSKSASDTRKYVVMSHALISCKCEQQLTELDRSPNLQNL